MSAMAAIIARLGLDSADFRKGLQQAVQDTQAAHNRMAEAAHGTTAAHEHLLGSSHRVARQIGTTAQKMLSGGSAADVFSTALEGLERSLHLPLGALAGLGVLAVGIEKFHEYAEEAKKVREEVEKALQPNQATAFSGTSEIKKRLEETTAAAKQVTEESKGFFKNLFAYIGSAHLLGGHGFDAVVEGRAKSRDALAKQAQDQQDQLTGKERESLELAEKKLRIGEHAAALAKIEAEFAEKRGEAIAEGIATGTDTSARVAVLKEQETVAKEIEDQKHEASLREVEHEERLNAIRKAGADEAVNAAHERVEQAEEAVKAATEEGKRGAEAKLTAAQTEYDIAVRTSALKEAERQSQTMLAGLIADADSRHHTALLEAQRLLEEERDASGTTPDRRNDIAVALAVNQQQQQDDLAARAMKGFDTSNAGIDAGTGLGQAEAQRALREKLIVEQSRLGFQQASGLFSDSDLESQRAKIAGMVRQQQDIAEAVEKTNRDSKATTAIMEQELEKHHSIAEELRTQLDYAERIRQAKKDGNTELAAELAKQQQLTLAVRARKLAEQKHDTVALGLQDIAEHGHGADRAAARKAIKLEEQSRKAALRNDLEKAKALHDEAEAIKRGIGSLRESDKENPDLAGRLGPGPGKPSLADQLKPHLGDLMKPHLGDLMKPHLGDLMKPLAAEVKDGLNNKPGADDKDDNLKGAIDSSEVLNGILENTANLGVNV